MMGLRFPQMAHLKNRINEAWNKQTERQKKMAHCFIPSFIVMYFSLFMAGFWGYMVFFSSVFLITSFAEWMDEDANSSS